MKNFMIIFIMSIIVLGFVVGQCNNTSDLCSGDGLEISIDTKYIDRVSSGGSDETNELEVKKETNNTEIEEYTIIDSVCLVQVPSSVSNLLLVRTTYLTSYNKDTKCPNWVAWHLIAEHTDGIIARQKSFYEDLEVSTPRATNEDYRRSGWSRGHMCPAGDNKWDAKAMRESNLLTNVCPQHASLNSGLWNVIERDCRKWAQKYGGVYIVCGPLFLKKEHFAIGANRVVVPDAFFKVILRLNPQPTAIGFIVGNDEGKKIKSQYINTVDEVERITGYDFFHALPDSIENVVEAQSDIRQW